MKLKNDNTFTVDTLVVPNMKNLTLPPIRQGTPEVSEINKRRIHEYYPQTPAVQNNNQFYNNQQYIQVVYPPQNENHNYNQENYKDTELPMIANSSGNLKNTEKFVKIARKNYEKDQNLNYSHLQNKYINRNYSENEEEEYIYLYKENHTPPKRNETPDTVRIEIFNLNNQCNILKNENYFLNQKVYELNMEVMRLQQLNMKLSNFRGGFDDIYSKQNESFNTFNYESTYDLTQVKNRLMPREKEMFNVDKFIEHTIGEFENFK